MYALGSVFNMLVPFAILAGLLFAVAYQYDQIRRIGEQAFGIVQRIFQEIAGGFDRLASAAGGPLGSLRDALTANGRWKLAFLVVIVLVLTPFVLLALSVERAIWAAWFSHLFTGTVDVPFLGEVPEGDLRAALPVAAGVLVGLLCEGLLGIYPLPTIAALASETTLRRVKAVLWALAIAFWVLLAGLTADVAATVYDDLGREVCAQRSADTPEPLGDEIAVPVGAEAPLVAPSVETPVASPQSGQSFGPCLDAWKADDRARFMNIALAETALHFSAIFGWVLLALVGLAIMAALGAVVGVLNIAAWLARLSALVVSMLFGLVDLVIGLISNLGRYVARLFGGRPPDGNPPGAPAGAPAAPAPAGPNQPAAAPNGGAGPRPVAPNGATHIPTPSAANGTAQRPDGRAPVGVAASPGQHPTNGTAAAVTGAGPGHEGPRRPTVPEPSTWDL